MDREKHPFAFDDFLKQRRVSQPSVSPDGRWVVFAVTRPDLEQNRNIRHLYRVPLQGGPVEQLTSAGSSNGSPAFSPDGAWLAFVSNRDGTPQVWVLPMAGGEARQVSRLPQGASQPCWAPDGSYLLVSSPVFPDTSDLEEVARRVQQREDSGVSARVTDALMFRHWDTWTEGLVDHLLRVDVASAEAQDLTPGPWPVPPRSLTAAPDFAVSPDGEEICFVSLRHEEQAVSTNTNLWLMPAAGGEPRRISPLPGSNAFPAWSPCGRYIAYGGMRRAGYESDRRRLMLYDHQTGETRELVSHLDASISQPNWSPDGRWLVFYVEDRGRNRLVLVDVAADTWR